MQDKNPSSVLFFMRSFFFLIICGKIFFPSLDAAGARLQNVLEVLIFLPLVLVTKQTRGEKERKKGKEKTNLPS